MTWLPVGLPVSRVVPKPLGLSDLRRQARNDSYVRLQVGDLCAGDWYIELSGQRGEQKASSIPRWPSSPNPSTC